MRLSCLPLRPFFAPAFSFPALAPVFFSLPLKGSNFDFRVLECFFRFAERLLRVEV